MSKAKPAVPFRWAAATQAHEDLIWRWRNDPVARRNSIRPEKIPLPRHRDWFRRRLADPDCLILIARDCRGRCMGQLRLDYLGRGSAEVSISLDRRVHGQGIGTRMLRRMPASIEKRPLKRYVAHIKPDNIGSVIAFVKAGFRFDSVRKLDGTTVYRLVKNA